MPYNFNPFTGTLDYYVAGISYIGGLYGINVETLAAAKTLTPGTDYIYQYLDEGGANRIITLATAGATAGDIFVIRHNGDFDDTHYLQVKQAATELDKIYVTAIKEFIFNGTNWVPAAIGTGENDNRKYDFALGIAAMGDTYGLAIGNDAQGTTYGVSIGRQSRGYTYGAAVGYGAVANNFGAALGTLARGQNYGVGVGYYASSNNKYYSTALGYYAKATRYAETTMNIDGSDTQKNNMIIVGFTKSTTDNTPIEMLCGGVAAQRCTIRASSALAFKIQVTARDNVAGHAAMYTFEGLIKRDAANNTILSVVNKTVIFEDDATWDANVTADDVNEALVITVTGDDTNPTQWAARLDGVETHF
jgi:hypothetical protein